MIRGNFILFCLLVIFIACDKEEMSDSQLSLQNESKELIADGFSKKRIELKIGNEDFKNKHVKFTTTNGNFLPINATATTAGTDNITVKAIDGFASVFLKSSTTVDDHVIVTAQIDDEYFNSQLNFIHSRPDTFYLRSDGSNFSVNQTTLNVVSVSSTFNSRPITGTQYIYFSTEVIKGDSLDFYFPPYMKLPVDSSNIEVTAVLQRYTEDTLSIKITASMFNQENNLMEKQIIVNFNK